MRITIVYLILSTHEHLGQAKPKRIHFRVQIAYQQAAKLSKLVSIWLSSYSLSAIMAKMSKLNAALE